jgi:hypothetical protein
LLPPVLPNWLCPPNWSCPPNCWSCFHKLQDNELGYRYRYHKRWKLPTFHLRPSPFLVVVTADPDGEQDTFTIYFSVSQLVLCYCEA